MKALKIITFILVGLYLFLWYIGKKTKTTLYKGKNINRESSREEVKSLQNSINDYFICKGLNDRLKVDGIYGKKTKSAVILIHKTEPTSIEQINEYIDCI